MLQKLFLDHPRSVDETYLQHFAFALCFRYACLGGICRVGTCTIPCAFEKTASKTVHDLYLNPNRGS